MHTEACQSGLFFWLLAVYFSCCVYCQGAACLPTLHWRVWIQCHNLNIFVKWSLLLLPVTYSLTHLATTDVSAHPFSASGFSSGPLLHPPIPLQPGADVALQAACSPVSMTTRMTSAWGLNITVRTPNQLNPNNTFLIAIEIFLVTTRKGVDGWGNVKRGRKFHFPPLAAYTVTTLHFPQAPQQTQLLSEIILSYPWSCCLHPQCHYDQLQMLGWPQMSYLLLRWKEGWHNYCLSSHSVKQGSTQLFSGQTSALASHGAAEQGARERGLATLQWAGGEVCCKAVTFVPLQKVPYIHTATTWLMLACLSAAWESFAWE